MRKQIIVSAPTKIRKVTMFVLEKLWNLLSRVSFDKKYHRIHFLSKQHFRLDVVLVLPLRFVQRISERCFFFLEKSLIKRRLINCLTIAKKCFMAIRRERTMLPLFLEDWSGIEKNWSR